MRRYQQGLIAAGILIFALGAGLGLLTSQLAGPHEQPVDASTPMTEACLTCHSEEYRAAERALQSMTIRGEEQAARPATPAGTLSEGLMVVPVSSNNRPYTVTGQPEADLHAPALRYRMRIDEAEALLPEAWHGLDPALFALGMSTPALCEACHVATPTPDSGLAGL